VSASLREADTQSKDPYERHYFCRFGETETSTLRSQRSLPLIGVLRLRLSVRKQTDKLAQDDSSGKWNEPAKLIDKGAASLQSFTPLAEK
jgi:hypothetical protein